MSIERVAEPDLGELLPLMRGYCDFYEVSPSDEALLALARVLIADPEREGVQLLAPEKLSAAGIGPSEKRFLAAVERVNPELARAA